jgi:class 3 adenylate cyclase
VGDTVNRAARLEAHTKVIGEPILIDANTQAGLNGDLITRPYGLLEFKGKTQPVNVFAVPVAQTH